MHLELRKRREERESMARVKVAFVAAGHSLTPRNCKDGLRCLSSVDVNLCVWFSLAPLGARALLKGCPA